MKKLNFIFLMCIPFLFQSCQGQNLDLEKLSLPINGDELKVLKLSSSNVGIGTEEVQYTSYVSDVDSDVRFGGVEAPQSKTSSQSLIEFYSKNKGNSFQGYTLNLFTPNAFEKVLKYFLENKSKFKLVYDGGKDSQERARVFISNKDGSTYFQLSMLDNEGKKHGYIFAIAKGEEPLLSSRTKGGAFGYYGEFLEYKKQKSKPANFSYLDFLREANSEIYNKENNLK